MVTVELAVGFVTATLLAATLSVVVLLGVAQAACASASTEMARQLARGDEASTATARDHAPAGSQFSIDRRPDGVAVVVVAPVPVFGLGAINVSAQRWAAWEPGVGSGPRG